MEIIDPARPVVFVNTDIVGYHEELNAKKLINIGEAELVKRIVSSLLTCDMSCGDIGVICPYRNQLKVLRDSILAAGDTLQNRMNGIEVDTIDRYQVWFLMLCFVLILNQIDSTTQLLSE